MFIVSSFFYIFFYPSLIFADIDDCVDQPCQNGATCIDAVNDYTCNCVNGYTGKNCSIGKDGVSVVRNEGVISVKYSSFLLLYLQTEDHRTKP